MEWNVKDSWVGVAVAAGVFLPYHDKEQVIFKLWGERVQLCSQDHTVQKVEMNSVVLIDCSAWPLVCPEDGSWVCWELGIAGKWGRWGRKVHMGSLPPLPPSLWQHYCRIPGMINMPLSWLPFQTHVEFGSWGFQFPTLGIIMTTSLSSTFFFFLDFDS